MRQSQPGTLVERLEQLERQNQRFKIAGIAVVIGGFILVMGGADQNAPPKVVKAEQIILHDKEGKERAVFAVDQEGSPKLEFHDKEGKVRIAIGIEQIGPNIMITDKNNKGKIILLVNEFGASQLDMEDPDGDQLSLLAAGKPDNRTAMTFGDAKRGTLLQIANQPDGFGSGISFCDKNGDARLNMGTNQDGSSDAIFQDKTGEKRFILGAEPDGTPFLK